MTYLTEEEATQSQCLGPPNVGEFRHDAPVNMPHYPRFCEGSRCKMAWRWKARVVYHDPEMHDEPKGYCGLAGKPEE